MSLLRKLRRLAERARRPRDLSRYRKDAAGYCRDVLGVELTDAQRDICRAVVEPPFKVLVPSGHIVGKSFVAACLVSWWFDTRPGICLTTAPTDRQVKDILWKEVRKVRARAGLGGFAGPKVPRLEASADHFAHGYTARDATNFQGQHEGHVLIVFDEAEGVGPEFWEAADSMLNGESYAFVAFYNPTQAQSATAEEERSGRCRIVRLSSLEHPNIGAELRGEPPPFPSAMRLARLRELLDKWGRRIHPRERQPGDVRVGDHWWRPGPVAEARLLGRRPGKAFNAVFPDTSFDVAELVSLPDHGHLQLGCDVARYGDDETCIHVRKGGVSLHHESWQGLSVPKVAERCYEVANQAGQFYGVAPKRIPVAVDDCGVGGGVTDLGGEAGWYFVGVNTACEAPEPDEYPNLRSALWFGMADAAAKGLVSFARLEPDVRRELRRQFTAPVYRLDLAARRVVEPKEKTKERLGRSPDGADAVLLAYCDVGFGSERVAGAIRVA